MLKVIGVHPDGERAYHVVDDEAAAAKVERKLALEGYKVTIKRPAANAHVVAREDWIGPAAGLPTLGDWMSRFEEYGAV